MSTFPAEGVASTLLVKVSAPGDKLLNGLLALLDNGSHRLFIAKPGACIDGVGNVLLGGVAGVPQDFRKDCGNPSLCPGGI